MRRQRETTQDLYDQLFELTKQNTPCPLFPDTMDVRTNEELFLPLERIFTRWNRLFERKTYEWPSGFMTNMQAYQDPLRRIFEPNHYGFMLRYDISTTLRRGIHEILVGTKEEFHNSELRRCRFIYGDLMLDYKKPEETFINHETAQDLITILQLNDHGDPMTTIIKLYVQTMVAAALYEWKKVRELKLQIEIAFKKTIEEEDRLERVNGE